MEGERPYYDKEELVPQLWAAYTKTPEYSNGAKFAMPSIHQLIRSAEDRGLEKILASFIKQLLSKTTIRTTLVNRNIGDWLGEWRQMHGMLFHDVFLARGEFRDKEVRFGSPGDEDRHNIPLPHMITYELSMLVRTISDGLQADLNDTAEICKLLATIHYQFIRIHPFPDGNGRIARVLTDQVAISLGLPPVIAGFPRTNAEKKKIYHKGIDGCAEDPGCSSLASWIFQQIEEKSAELA